MGSYRYPSEQFMGMLRSELDFMSVTAIIRLGLHEYLDALQLKMNQIDVSLLNDFVAQTASETPKSPEIPVESSSQTQSQSQSQSGSQR